MKHIAKPAIPSTLQPKKNMPKYTASDFLASARASQTDECIQQPPASTVMVAAQTPPSPSSVHSPGFAPPSDTEPFPGFQTVLALDPVEEAEPLHCMIHCHQAICQNLVKYKFQRSRLPCWCAFEPTKTPEEYVPAVRLQKLDANAFQSLRGISIAAFDDPNQELELRRSDLLTLLSQLEIHMTRLASQNPILTRAIAVFLPQGAAAAAAGTAAGTDTTASRISSIIFQELSDYFQRSLGSSSTRTITVRQLHAELEVYLWTFLWKFAWQTCDEETAGLLSSGDLRMFGRRQYFGPFDAVVSYGWECVDQTLGLVIWRNQQIQLAKQTEAASKASQVSEWFSLGKLALHFSSWR